MGTDLYKLGNHKICFKGRSFIEIATEIKAILDNTKFPNTEFLRRNGLSKYSNHPRILKEIKTKNYWSFIEENEYYKFEDFEDITFDGPFGLNLDFNKNSIVIRDASMSYRQWFEFDDDVFRDEWRKYMHFIVNLFGGNRVLYAADHSHHLEKYIYFDGTFEEMEMALLKVYGKSKTTFQEVADDYENSYFIDDFSSVDWTVSMPLEKLYSDPDETVSLAYDLNIYAIKDNLKKLKFEDEFLYHKQIDNKMHFYHLARIDGLLCIHSGVVDEQEKLEVQLDEYAPATFDKLREAIEKEGYGDSECISFVIIFNGQDSFNRWSDALAAFKTELMWHGFGERGVSIFGEDEIEEYFYCVDEKLAIKLLLDLEEKYNAKGSIKIYLNVYTDDWFENDNYKKNRKLLYEQ